MKETTIAAISTAYGEAGIGIVRMSGPDSLDVLRKVFVPHVCRKSKDAAAGFDYMPRHMYYGQAVAADGSAIDECLAVYMPGPYSYTGEDVVELQCHGSVISYKKILSAFLEAGAVQCGYCTPGMLMSGIALLNLYSHPTREQIRKEMEGNLCRCTGYDRIADAVLLAVQKMDAAREEAAAGHLSEPSFAGIDPDFNEKWNAAYIERQ